ncbi:MAG: hypothetical protein V1765_03370 [bacterium]
MAPFKWIGLTTLTPRNIAIDPANNPKIQQCGGMTWQCVTADGIISAPCSADCEPATAPTPSIQTSATGTTGITNTTTNSTLTTIFNNILKILAGIQAELAKLKAL